MYTPGCIVLQNLQLLPLLCKLVYISCDFFSAVVPKKILCQVFSDYETMRLNFTKKRSPRFFFFPSLLSSS